MLANDYLDNYQLFVEQILDTGEVWGLVQDEGCAMCESTEDESKVVLPLWSEKALAEIHCKGDWLAYQVEKIELQDFVESWLPGMQEDDFLLGPNWNTDLQGLEIEPTELIAMFK